MTPADKRFLENFYRLFPQRERGTLSYVQPRGAQPGKRGYVEAEQQAPAASGGGGIASPLTETDNSRTYHPPQVVTSSDGVFTFYVEPVASATFVDGDTNTVVFNFDDPNS